jgi:hypothetical protein
LLSSSDSEWAIEAFGAVGLAATFLADDSAPLPRQTVGAFGALCLVWAKPVPANARQATKLSKKRDMRTLTLLYLCHGPSYQKPILHSKKKSLWCGQLGQQLRILREASAGHHLTHNGQITTDAGWSLFKVHPVKADCLDKAFSGHSEPIGASQKFRTLCNHSKPAQACGDNAGACRISRF